MKRTVLAAFAVLTFLVSVANAGLDEGKAAYKRGDYATAIREFRPFAEQGNAVAQYNLGVMYQLGRGITKDEAEAVKWYRKAAEQGLAPAQHNLGFMYEQGLGIAKDYPEAMRW